MSIMLVMPSSVSMKREERESEIQFAHGEAMAWSFSENDKRSMSEVKIMEL